MVVDPFARPALDTPPQGPAPDAVLAGFARLSRLLERPASEAALRAAAPVPEAGADLACVRRIAERLGFSARTLPASRGVLRRTSTPFLLLGEHPGEAWLARARTGKHLVLVDPLKGTANAVTVEAAAGMGSSWLLRLGLPDASQPRLWRSSLLRRLRPVLWQVGLASVVINLVALATPLFMMTVYNKVISHSALRTLDALAIGMASLFLFELTLRSLRGYLAAHTGARLEAALGSDVIHHLVRLPYRAFEATPAAGMLERLRQLDQLRAFLTGSLPLLIVDLAFVGLFLMGLLLLSPTLALVTGLIMPVFILLSALAHRGQSGLLRTGFRANAAKASVLNEAVAQALTVKALGLEAEMERRFDARLVESAWSGFRSGSMGQLVGSLGQGLQQVTALALIYIGAKLVIAGSLSVGALVAASILSARALAPMRQLFSAWTQLQQTREALRRLDALMHEAQEGGGSLEIQLQGRVRLAAATFRYADGKPPALNGIDLEVAPGEVLGVVGPPGSGKSTLIKLVLGLELPSEGQVLLDDHDLKSLSPLSVRSQIGIVPQEVQLFSGTIAENIAIGAQDRSLQRVIAAARFVGAHEFISRLPEGYETVLGERGTGLSLGQRQLIAVARALFRNPRLLILDEATSALDAASEAHLLQNLKRAGGGRTLILVTHRPAVLQICDRVVLLEEGRIARIGSAGEVTSAIQPRPFRGGLQVVASAEVS